MANDSRQAAEYEAVEWRSADGLKLFARDYPHPKPRATIVCMHGLTRNSADFEPVTRTLNRGYRLVIPDQRGRGLSEWDENPEHYDVLTYVDDTIKLLDALDLESVILFGTSMGGLMAMLMNQMHPDRVTATILNDIGPVVNPAGLERIKSYVGKVNPVTSWAQAIEQTRAINESMFPDVTDECWAAFARQLYTAGSDGVPVLAYDPLISAPIAEDETSAVPQELWPVFASMQDKPLLVLRGEYSDILAPDCVDEMQRRHALMRYWEVPRVGHAPMLTEPGMTDTLLSFLGSF